MGASSSEENKAVVRRYVEEYQIGGRSEVATELVAEDLIHHSGPAWAGTKIGREWATMFVTMLHGAFPDIKAVIHDQIAESDMVVTRKTFYGTHLGEFMGVAATGKSVVIDGIDIIRIADGRLAEHWTVVDTLGLMQQIGALSSPGPSSG
jgi:steroid delta-isomerase-like uncharacterized protein